jgi:hypothetical protein
MVNVVMVNVVLVNVVMLNAVMLNVVMLNVVMLNVVAPEKQVCFKNVFKYRLCVECSTTLIKILNVGVNVSTINPCQMM